MGDLAEREPYYLLRSAVPEETALSPEKNEEDVPKPRPPSEVDKIVRQAQFPPGAVRNRKLLKEIPIEPKPPKKITLPPPHVTYQLVDDDGIKEEEVENYDRRQYYGTIPIDGTTYS